MNDTTRLFIALFLNAILGIGVFALIIVASALAGI